MLFSLFCVAIVSFTAETGPRPSDAQLFGCLRTASAVRTFQYP